MSLAFREYIPVSRYRAAARAARNAATKAGENTIKYFTLMDWADTYDDLGDEIQADIDSGVGPAFLEMMQKKYNNNDYRAAKRRERVAAIGTFIWETAPYDEFTVPIVEKWWDRNRDPHTQDAVSHKAIQRDINEYRHDGLFITRYKGRHRNVTTYRRTMKGYERGTQVLMVPPHAEGDLDHPEVERGFINLVNDKGTIFCRFWNQGDPLTLRTLANSQGVDRKFLVIQDSVPQSKVEAAIKQIDIENEQMFQYLKYEA